MGRSTVRDAGLKLEPGNYSVRPADGTSAHLALDCDGRTQPFVLDLSNTTLVMQARPRLCRRIAELRACCRPLLQ